MYNKKEYNRLYRERNRQKLLHAHRTKYAGIYASWYSMKRRCNNKRFFQYKDYGGRGIRYDERWEKFENFKTDMQDGWKKGLTLERIDNNGHYCKENCRWATRKEQNNNKRKHIFVVHQGKKITLAQYADLTQSNFDTLRSRYYRGMSLEKLTELKDLRLKTR